MAVMDEFKEERAALKKASFKEKFNYFWYYYKWYVIGGIALIIMVSSFIHQYLSQKDNVFYAAMLNTSMMTDGSDLTQGYADYAGIDLESSEVYFDTTLRASIDGIYTDILGDESYTTLQKLAVYTSAQELDTMITDMTSFQKYANSYTFYDLRDILTEEQIAKYEPYFYYVDQKIVDEIEAANAAWDDSYVPVYPDPTKPEEMDTPIPVGIFLDASEAAMENFYFRGEGPVMGVYCNTLHLENTLRFIDYLFQ